MKILFEKTAIGLLLVIGLMGMLGLSESERIINTKEVSRPPKDTPPARMLFDENKWADSLFGQLTLEQKIGQLFMVATYSDRNETYYRYVDQLIQNYHIGSHIL